MESSNEIHLIVGLGNYQDCYAGTKHNAGRMAVEHHLVANNFGFYELLKSNVIDIKKEAYQWAMDHFGFNDPYLVHKKEVDSCIAKFNVMHRNIYLLPETGMNDSGKAVKPIILDFNIDPKNILVIVDDIDLPIGNLKLTHTGKSRHNGVKSIMSELEVNELDLLRIGIGKPEKGTSVLDYVLSGFSPDDMKKMDLALYKTISAVTIWLEYNPNDKNSKPFDFYINRISMLNN